MLLNHPIKGIPLVLFTRGWTSMGEIAVVFVRGIKMNSKRAVKIFTIRLSFLSLIILKLKTALI